MKQRPELKTSKNYMKASVRRKNRSDLNTKKNTMKILNTKWRVKNDK